MPELRGPLHGAVPSRPRRCSGRNRHLDQTAKSSVSGAAPVADCCSDYWTKVSARGGSGVVKLRRIAYFLLFSALALALGGCTLPTFGAFRGATTQGQTEFKLWSWMTITGLVRR